MREHLLGYLLGALDASEHEQVEQELRTNETLRHEADILRRQLSILDDGTDEEAPPAGLAARTCALVARLAAEERPQRARAARLGSTFPVEGRRNRWSVADWVVAGGVVAATALLFLPVIANSREMARLSLCQDHLRELGVAAIGFSDVDADHSFPAVPSEGKLAFAGIYGPRLVEGGFLSDPTMLICPSSELAENLHSWRLPTIDEIQQAGTVKLVALQQNAGGSYGYNLGVVDAGRHVPNRNQGRSHFAIMSDSPNSNPLAAPPNHHLGRGQNVLYEDGHVMFIVSFPQDCADNPFRNRHGNVEAGLDREDAVIGSSPTAPFVRYVNLRGADPAAGQK